MSVKVLEAAISEGRMKCPKCKNPVKKYDNFRDLCGSVWDGPGDSGVKTEGSTVTLICGNDGCSWEERTEYWDNYIDD